MPGTVLGQHYATDFLGRAITQVCAAVIAAAESDNVRAYIWEVLNGISAAVEDLKDYSDIVHRLNGMLVQHMDDTEAGREAVIRYAFERIRRTKEQRPKRVWKKRPATG